MLYKSLNKISKKVNFENAVKNGLADDGGLYFPLEVKHLGNKFFKTITKKSNHEIAYDVITQFVGNSIDKKNLTKIIKQTLTFNFPLIKIDNKIRVLELYHGPTLAFKDVGARFMANCLNYFNKSKKHNSTILVATSGDTGAAVANGFLGVDGTQVIILYPNGKVSDIQERQLTTNGKNIIALKVDGTFDDCQKIVKKAFLDNDLNNVLNLTSANSINVARWLPQSFYYFFAYREFLNDKENNNKELCISVPSGNFGNICAGIISKKLGLPINHFIASTNVNDTVPKFLETGNYIPKSSVQTISNAMDVGNPSNFVRITEIFDNDLNEIKKLFSSYSFNDSQTIEAISSVYNKHKYILDPHGAIGYLGLKKYLNENISKIGIFLETAHPVKFAKDVEKTLGFIIDKPKLIEKLIKKDKKSIKIKNYNEFKNELLKLIK
jgi:threonine synthase